MDTFWPDCAVSIPFDLCLKSRDQIFSISSYNPARLISQFPLMTFQNIVPKNGSMYFGM